MKNYNIQNYIKYKEDIDDVMDRLPNYGIDYEKYTRNELITKFMPLVENLARRFSTSQQASGVLSVLDLIQFGHIGLIKAVDRIDWEMFDKSENKEQTIKSFLTKRIKGSIRRAIDINRGDMRIPEHKLNDIRKRFGKDEKMVAMFFNSIFLSIEDQDPDGQPYDVPDKSEPYNKEILNLYLKSLLKKHLSVYEYEVLRLSYGLDCKKHFANEIAQLLNIKGNSAYVRVSQLKRQAVDKLIANVDHSQVLDYL
jgi:RNA polymerase sigma factor (sigma-70 family)|tara:strand:+ start:176 stop:934 length:759 start_codon:yes stop_codon:yes gene_type:complete